MVSYCLPSAAVTRKFRVTESSNSPSLMNLATVSSTLSRMKRDGAVDHDGERYRLKAREIAVAGRARAGAVVAA